MRDEMRALEEAIAASAAAAPAPAAAGANSAAERALLAMREFGFGAPEWDDGSLQWLATQCGEDPAAAVEMALSFGTAAAMRRQLGDAMQEV